MIQKPSFTSDEFITSSILEQYGIGIFDLEFLPIGEDSWSFKAKSTKGELFIKISKNNIYKPSLNIPSYLYQNLHYTCIIPPVPTKDNQLYSELSNHDLIIYPYVKGSTVMDSKLDRKQWIQLGEIFSRLHNSILPSDLSTQLRKETFVPQWLDGANKVINFTSKEGLSEISLELVEFIDSKKDEIRKITKRTVELGKSLQIQNLDFVLCHSDPNRANILISNTHDIYILDWDGLMLAPRERDLMFFTEDDQKEFFTGYSKTSTYNLNHIAIAYYAYEWVVQEINDYGLRVLFSDFDLSMKSHALNEFKKLFQPGDVIDGAYNSDKDLQN